jgi:cytochrome P450
MAPRPVVVGRPELPQRAAYEILSVGGGDRDGRYWLPTERTRLATADTDAAMAFTHQVRRFYPFAPLVAARARDLYFDDTTIPSNTLVLLDVFGQNHHRDLWPDPWTSPLRDTSRVRSDPAVRGRPRARPSLPRGAGNGVAVEEPRV